MPIRHRHRPRAFAPTTLALAAGLGLVGTPAGVSVAAAPKPTAVGVAAREYSLSLYRSTVKPGKVTFNLTNFGEDGHDLEILSPTGRPLERMPKVVSRSRGTLTLTLRAPGRYTLLCTLPGHARRGMKAKLVVRR